MQIVPGLYIVSSSEEEEEDEGEEDEDGLVMLRIWYSFRKVVKVTDDILDVYLLSLINIEEKRKYE